MFVVKCLQVLELNTIQTDQFDQQVWLEIYDISHDSHHMYGLMINASHQVVRTLTPSGKVPIVQPTLPTYRM